MQPTLGLFLLWISLAALGCARKADPVAEEMDLAPAVGAAAACRTLTSSEAGRQENVQRAAKEQVLTSVLQTWLREAPVERRGGPEHKEVLLLDVEVIQTPDGPVVEATAEYEGRSAKLRLGAARRGGADDPVISIFAMAKDDPLRTADVGGIDASGRISFTNCGEVWSLPPSEAAARSRHSAGEVVGASGPPVESPTVAYFGGRTPAWWTARLTELKKEGPPALYALALQRARAAGFAVQERADDVSVQAPSRGANR